MLSIFRPFFLEFHNAVLLRVQGVITSYTYIHSRVNLGATLANDDVARNYMLTAVNLDAQSFTFRIATVLSAAACLFMSHCNIPSVYQKPVCLSPMLSNSV